MGGLFMDGETFAQSEFSAREESRAFNSGDSERRRGFRVYLS